MALGRFINAVVHAPANAVRWELRTEGHFNREQKLQEDLNELAGRKRSAQWTNDLLDPHGSFERDRGHSAIHEQQRFPPSLPAGMRVPGNIDLRRRPVVVNPDRSISTVRSISFSTPKGEVLVPQVVGGKVVSPSQAWQHFLQTGEHLGIFRDATSANRYAEQLHLEQQKQFAPAAFQASIGHFPYVPGVGVK